MGTVIDDPLTAIATSFNSSNLQYMSVVSGGHAIVTIDPLRQYGEPEIVIVTSHSASSTVATIQRGAYGTTARQHPQFTVWIHQPVDEDWIEILTSGTRPADPYRGQMIYEYDTDTFVARSNTDAWQSVMPLGQWTTYTPVLTAATSNPTLGTGSFVAGRYRKVGRNCQGWAKIKFGTSGSTFGTGAYRISLPIEARTPAANETIILGNGYMYDLSVTTPQFFIPYQDSTFSPLVAQMMIWTTAIIAGPTAPFTWAVGDEIVYRFSYETAT